MAIYKFKSKVRAPRRKRALKLTELISDPFDLDAHLPFRISCLDSLLNVARYSAAAKIAALGRREIRVLLNVGSYMPLRASDICYHTRSDPFTVSRGVIALKKAGLIEERSDVTDQRGYLLYLTEEGIALYKKLTKSIESRGQQLRSVLTPAEQELFFDMLDRLEDQAEEILAGDAREQLISGDRLTADQKAILRWHKRGV